MGKEDAVSASPQTGRQPEESVMQVNLEIIKDLQNAIALGDEAAAKAIAEKNPEMIAEAAKQVRAFARQGQPLTTRFTGWIEDVKYAAGVKFLLTEAIPAGASLGLIGKGILTAYRWVRG